MSEFNKKAALIVKKTIQYGFNIDFRKFSEDMKDVIEGAYLSPSYLQEKFNVLRQDFGKFFCDLDSKTQAKFVKKALEHYGITEEDF